MLSVMWMRVLVRFKDLVEEFRLSFAFCVTHPNLPTSSNCSGAGDVPAPARITLAMDDAR